MNTIEKAINAIYKGELAECSKEEYPKVRTALQDKAGEWIDNGDNARAMIALNEVKRLDALHEFSLFPPSPNGVI